MSGVDGFREMLRRFAWGMDKEELFISGTDISCITHKEFNSIPIKTLVLNCFFMSLILGFILAIIYWVWGYCYFAVCITKNPKSLIRIFTRDIRIC